MQFKFHLLRIRSPEDKSKVPFLLHHVFHCIVEVPINPYYIHTTAAHYWLKVYLKMSLFIYCLLYG